MADAHTRAKQNISRFYETFGSVGKIVLDVFNDYDLLDLNPNGGDVPPDEYLSYVQRFVKMLEKTPEHKRTEIRIARLLFRSFRPEDFLGIEDVYKRVGDNKDMQKIYSSFGTPMITPEDIIILAQNIFAGLKRSAIRIVVDNTKNAG
ncbi:MAG TPA: hypothetical protein VJB70_03430 [Candidatus Paceibacterota bacterium]